MRKRSHAPVSRRTGLAKAPLGVDAVVGAGLAVADREGLGAVTMRRVARELDTSASALYVYVRGRDDLLALMLDRVLAKVAGRPAAGGDARGELRALLAEVVEAARGHGGLAAVGLRMVPDGPNVRAVTERVRALLREVGVPPGGIPAVLDLLALFVSAAALDSPPGEAADPGAGARRRRLAWEIDVLLSGVAATPWQE